VESVRSRYRYPGRDPGIQGDFYVTDYDPEHRRFLAVLHTGEGEPVDRPLRLTLDW
jgi:hypothetical protein